VAQSSDILITNLDPKTKLPFQVSQFFFSFLNKPDFSQLIQIDGEAEIESFKEIHITHLNQVSMLEYVPPRSKFRGLLSKMKSGFSSSFFCSFLLSKNKKILIALFCPVSR